MARLSTLLIASLLLPLGASAEVVWRGDFESGDRLQWSHTQMVSADRLALVQAPSPVAQGKYALKATVRQGDDPISSSGNRNELVRMTYEDEGDEFYYRWLSYFPADFPAPDTWQLFVQWHQMDGGGSPPVEFVVRDEHFELVTNSSSGTRTVQWTAPFVRGRWVEFIFHIKWSAKASSGFIELYLDGKLVLARRAAATLHSGQTNYLKAGLYRNESIQPTASLYLDGFVQATSLADVLTLTSGTPPASGTPGAGPASQPGGTPSLPSSVDFEPGDADAPQAAQGCTAAGGSLGLLSVLLGLPALVARRRRRA
jgi:hypothetical protein